MIRRIGAWVLDESIRHAVEWAATLPDRADFVISVNLSARQLTSPELVDTVRSLLERFDWPPAQLMLELTESVLIDDRDAAFATLGVLKDLGVRLAIDDFGTGYSSLNYLHRFPVDVVKIDRSFVAALEADGSGSPVATAVLQVAKVLGLICCAEGVEEQGQLDALRLLGCDWAQGFHFAEGAAARGVRRAPAPRPDLVSGADRSPGTSAAPNRVAPTGRRSSMACSGQPLVRVAHQVFGHGTGWPRATATSGARVGAVTMASR